MLINFLGLRSQITLNFQLVYNIKSNNKEKPTYGFKKAKWFGRSKHKLENGESLVLKISGDFYVG